MIRPGHRLYSKQLGNHTNALFLDADESCISAFRYQHSGLTYFENFKPEYKGIQKAAELSLERLRDGKKDSRGGMRALARNGKTYTSQSAEPRKWRR